MSLLPDGIYSIDLPFGGGSITDVGEGRFLSILPPGSVSPTANQIRIQRSPVGGPDTITLQFVASKKFIGYTDEDVHPNTKLIPGDRPVNFRLERSPRGENQFSILLAENPDYWVGSALERIFPPWVALLPFPDKQAWLLTKLPKANL